MGYKRELKILKLRFADDEYDGLEVSAKSVPVDQILKVMQLATMVKGKVSQADLENITSLFRNFARALVSWNLEDENGSPVPATEEGVLSQDLDFMLTIVLAWMEAVSGVSGPLPESSNGGQQSPEALLPMEVL